MIYMIYSYGFSRIKIEHRDFINCNWWKNFSYYVESIRKKNKVIKYKFLEFM